MPTATGREAVLWSPTGTGTDLGALLGPDWTHTTAVGLNNQGDTIGFGDYQGLYVYGFLLTPVSSSPFSAAAAAAPEFHAVPMFIAGLAALALHDTARGRESRMPRS